MVLEAPEELLRDVGRARPATDEVSGAVVTVTIGHCGHRQHFHGGDGCQSLFPD